MLLHEAGASAIGLVLLTPVPARSDAVPQARAIIASAAAPATTVGLSHQLRAQRDAGCGCADMLQLYGDETPEECDGYHRLYIKALRVKAGDEALAAGVPDYRNARGALPDTYVEGAPGGTGETSDQAIPTT